MAAHIERALFRAVVRPRRIPFRRKVAPISIQFKKPFSATRIAYNDQDPNDAEPPTESSTSRKPEQRRTRRNEDPDDDEPPTEYVPYRGPEKYRQRAKQDQLMEFIVPDNFVPDKDEDPDAFNPLKNYQNIPRDAEDNTIPHYDYSDDSLPMMQQYAHAIMEKTEAEAIDPQDPFDDEDAPEQVYKTEDMGYWAEGEEEQLPDDPFHNDDITNIGHTALETHRELRHYARLATWDLPLLSRLARPFEPPSQAQPLRFRYTTYLGEEHPAAHKVVVEFAPADLPNLKAQEMAKLIKLAGPRYNPATEVVKISCEMFDTQLQNKRWLLDTTNALIKEAKEGDTFEDVPFDFRYYKPKVQHKFPKEWLMTEAKKQALDSKRQLRLEAENTRLNTGTLIDGRVKIQQSQLPSPAESLTTPDMATIGVEAQTMYRGRRKYKRNAF